MSDEAHFRALESMYAAAPVNTLIPPRLRVSEGYAEIQVDVKECYFHSAGAVHGSILFKVLDDAAFFAANSFEKDVFVLTTSFTTYLTRPVSEGVIISEGRIVNSNKSQWIAEAVVKDDQGRELGRGNGIFVRGKLPLAEAKGYALGG